MKNKKGKLATEENFYQDIDKKERSCCSCQAMALFFGLLFMAGALGVWYFFQAIQGGEFKSLRKVVPSQEALNSLNIKFQESLKLSRQKQDLGEKGEVILTITEQELTSLIASNEDAFNKGVLVIKDITALIKPSGIEFYGQMSRPIRTSIKIISAPSVENGNIKMDIVSVETGKIKSPDFVVSEIGKIFENLINGQLKQDAITHISRIELFDKEMALTGRVNQ